MSQAVVLQTVTARRSAVMLASESETHPFMGAMPMCRWMAYSGSPILLEDMLFRPQHSLIDQSMSSRSAETPTNGDGFGIGWYGYKGRAGLYRSIRPAWNDFN